MRTGTTSSRMRSGPGAAGQVLTVLVLVVAPLPVVYLLVPDSRSVRYAALAHELCVYPSVLAAGLLFYISWRMSQDSTTGWLAAGVTFVGAQGLGASAVHLAQPGAAAQHAGWLAMVDLGVQLVVVVVTVLAARHVLRVDPFVLGLLCGLLTTFVRGGVLELPSMDLTEASLRRAAVVLVLLQLVGAVLIGRLPRSPLWVRARVAAAVVLLAGAHLLSAPTRIGGAVGDGASVLLTVSGCVVLVTAGLALLQHQLQRQRGAIRGLHERVEHLEADVRTDRARLHEVGATIAGIAHASRLLHSGELPAQARRRDLERMVDAEMARLQRLVDRRRTGPLEDVALGTALEPLVTAHRARGRQVHWQPSGLQVRCRPDDLVEVVNILLENAAQHAGTDVTIDARSTGDDVEIQVCDRGPGVPAGLVEEVFAWGHRGRRSSGQGIGLNIALRLMNEQDGDLRLETRTGGGATFVLTLPAAPASSEGGSAERAS